MENTLRISNRGLCHLSYLLSSVLSEFFRQLSCCHLFHEAENRDSGVYSTNKSFDILNITSIYKQQ